eukprot:scaffold36044_cov22-Tisochrysis_lutea.AAC.1
MHRADDLSTTKWGENLAVGFHAHWVKSLFRDLIEAAFTIRGYHNVVMMAVCLCWSATRMLASTALLIVFVGPRPL